MTLKTDLRSITQSNNNLLEKMGESDKILKKINSIMFPDATESDGKNLLTEIENLIDQKK